MPAFRFYFIGVSRKIVDTAALDCADDDQAIEEAKKFLAARAAVQGVEVWDGARRVVSLTRG
ncbi:MAG: hypothetical protein ACLQJR_17160 [Stellaceae bacterium]